jgi:hypothetical protein
MGRGEERVRRIKEDEAREPEADQREELDREREGIEEVQGNPPPPTAHPAPVATVGEPRWFDWATETDKAISPIPNASDFRPTTLGQPKPMGKLMPSSLTEASSTYSS